MQLTATAVLLLGMVCITIYQMMETVIRAGPMLSTIPMGPKSRRVRPREIITLIRLTSIGQWGDTQHTTVLGTGQVVPYIVGVLQPPMMIRNAMVQCHLPILFKCNGI